MSDTNRSVSDTKGVFITPLSIEAAWNVQGHATNGVFTSEAARVFGVELPRAPNTTARTASLCALWLGPSSWLIVAGGASPLVDYDAKRDALNAAGGALFDVTASRVAWSIRGRHAPTLLATGCPLDLHPRAFAVGACAQSVFGHVNALFEKRDDAPTFTMLVARSFARDVRHEIDAAAAQFGCEVLAPQPYR